MLPFIKSETLEKAILSVLQKHINSKAQTAQDWLSVLETASAPDTDPGQTADATYGDFKAILYRRINPNFSEYFAHGQAGAVDLFAIRYSKHPDDIPVLFVYQASTKTAAQSRLKGTDIVYGFTMGKESRAYSIEYLKKHPYFCDYMAEKDLLVYWDGKDKPHVFDLSGEPRHFGISGFRYKGKPLLSDIATGTLWLADEGKLMVAEKQMLKAGDNRLPPVKIEQTTWTQWVKAHPGTTVLEAEATRGANL